MNLVNDLPSLLVQFVCWETDLFYTVYLVHHVHPLY